MTPGTSMIATPDVDGASFGMDSRSGIVHLHVETPGSVLHWHSPEERAMSQNTRSRRACDCQERGNRRGIARAEAQIILANLAFNLRRLVFQKTPEVAG